MRKQQENGDDFRAELQIPQWRTRQELLLCDEDAHTSRTGMAGRAPVAAICRYKQKRASERASKTFLGGE